MKLRIPAISLVSLTCGLFAWHFKASPTHIGVIIGGVAIIMVCAILWGNPPADKNLAYFGFTIPSGLLLVLGPLFAEINGDYSSLELPIGMLWGPLAGLFIWILVWVLFARRLYGKPAKTLRLVGKN